MTEVRLIYPMLAMVLLTFVVLIVLFRSRVRMVREGLAPVSYFRTFQGSLEEPDYAAKPARHFINLFEAPDSLLCRVPGGHGRRGVRVAGAGAGLGIRGGPRPAHALIHLGGNRVRHRLRAYFVSWLLLLGLWVHVGMTAAQRH